MCVVLRPLRLRQDPDAPPPILAGLPQAAPALAAESSATAVSNEAGNALDPLLQDAAATAAVERSPTTKPASRGAEDAEAGQASECGPASTLIVTEKLDASLESPPQASSDKEHSEPAAAAQDPLGSIENIATGAGAGSGVATAAPAKPIQAPTVSHDSSSSLANSENVAPLPASSAQPQSSLTPEPEAKRVSEDALPASTPPLKRRRTMEQAESNGDVLCAQPDAPSRVDAEEPGPQLISQNKTVAGDRGETAA